MDDLTYYFPGRTEISKAEIEAFYRQKEPGISQTAINWRIQQQLQKGVLRHIGRGHYGFGEAVHYLPKMPPFLVKIHKQLRGHYPYLDFCLWNTRQFNEFMVHQPGRFFTLVETDRESMEFVFDFLQERHKTLFLNPGRAEAEKYLSLAENAIVVRPLVSEAPIQNRDGVPTTTLEKLLTDGFCDSYLFAAQQGEDLEIIFNHAFQKYTINLNRLYRYASRRKRKKAIIEFLNDLNLV